MPTTLKSRKPVNELTVADLAAFPIWEFATDEEDIEGRDETWVRPVKTNEVPRDAYSQLVATDFTTVSGVMWQGFMTVTTTDAIEVTPGSLVGEGCYLVLPSMADERARREGLDWPIEARQDLLRVLGRPARAVFPISYTLRVRIRGEKQLRSGVVE
jgi:hypothetical protein